MERLAALQRAAKSFMRHAYMQKAIGDIGKGGGLELVDPGSRMEEILGSGSQRASAERNDKNASEGSPELIRCNSLNWRQIWFSI